jgi:hypothetical protein
VQLILLAASSISDIQVIDGEFTYVPPFKEFGKAAETLLDFYYEITLGLKGFDSSRYKM